MFGYWSGKLAGMSEATSELIKGVSVHYEHEGKKLPEEVSKTVDEMSERIRKAKTAREKCHAYELFCWGLGNAMGVVRWSRLSEQIFRVDKWSVYPG